MPYRRVEFGCYLPAWKAVEVSGRASKSGVSKHFLRDSLLLVLEGKETTFLNRLQNFKAYLKHCETSHLSYFFSTFVTVVQLQNRDLNFPEHFRMKSWISYGKVTQCFLLVLAWKLVLVPMLITLEVSPYSSSKLQVDPCSKSF